MVLQRSKYTRPGSVTLSVRLLRFRSRTPSRFSTCITCLLTIAVESSRCSAAATKLPDSTTWRNTLMLVSVSTRIVYVAARSCPSPTLSEGRVSSRGQGRAPLSNRPKSGN